MVKQKNITIGFLGCKSTTLHCMTNFIADGFKIDQLITLAPKQAEKYTVAGYYDLSSFVKEKKIPVYYPQKYSLRDNMDLKNIQKMNLHLLITIGWQRLVPKNILKSLKIGACGMHGSPRGLPYGRGRSPLNWALIQGEKQFITSLILYTPEIDAGKIIDSIKFDINQFDTCETLHFKNQIAMNMILKAKLSLLCIGKTKLKIQNKKKATYYPQRKPEDGVIDWNFTTEQIYNFIRAQTRPFSGAFTFINGTKITLWRAQPFDTKLCFAHCKPGEIIEVFHNQNFLVKTKNSSLLITEYDILKKYIKKGGKLMSIPYKKTQKKIIKRYAPFIKPKQYEIH